MISSMRTTFSADETRRPLVLGGFRVVLHVVKNYASSDRVEPMTSVFVANVSPTKSNTHWC